MNSGKIGIDLGTTFSCCGVFKNAAVDFLTFNESNKTIPSHVWYNPDSPEITIGNAAKNNPKAIGHDVFDSKRFIGREFDDPEVQKDMSYWPFKVIRGENNEPLVELKHNNKTIHLTANDISTEILKKIKEASDQYLGQNLDLPTEAVVTVPAYFNNQQRQNTIAAAENANIIVLKIINEPTAAAIAYAYQRLKEEEEEEEEEEKKDEETLLIYDFGGGTFDVSIIKIDFKNRIITVIATDGDSHLGGEDIDQNLVDYFLNKYKVETGREMNDKQKYKLKKACEATKCLLSTENNTEAVVDCETLDNAGVDNILTLEYFNRINANKFNETMDLVDSVVKQANLTNKDIDLLVLVGGSSRIKKVQELLKEKFPSSIICKNINPDEVVAYGACLYANLENVEIKEEVNNNNRKNERFINRQTPPKKEVKNVIPKLIVNDIITHTISTDIEEGGKTVLHAIIPKNTPIPLPEEKMLVFANFEDNADHIDISLFEGEGETPSDKGIHKIHCKPFPIPISHAAAGKYMIETKYKVNENGVLTIEVKDLQNGNVRTYPVELK